ARLCSTTVADDRSPRRRRAEPALAARLLSSVWRLAPRRRAARLGPRLDLALRGGWRGLGNEESLLSVLRQRRRSFAPVACRLRRRPLWHQRVRPLQGVPEGGPRRRCDASGAARAR